MGEASNMFIDYLPLLLINMAAGLFLLACYVYKGMDAQDQRPWGPAFGMVGIVALLNGLHMTWTWPLPGSYNVAFGEMSVLFGILFLAAAWALAQGRDLMPVAIYGFFAGGAAILIGIRIISLGLTKEPLLTGIGFVLSGMGGVFAAPILYLRTHRTLRIMGAVVLIAAAIIWAQTGYMAYWMHLSS